MAETASLPIDGWARDMFLSGNQVVVFSNVYVPRAIEGAHPICAPAPGPAMGIAAFCGYWASDVTEITTVDVSDMAHPRVTAEILLPGSYQSARRIDASVRVVMSDTFPFPDGVTYWPTLAPGASTDERNKAFDALEAANEALIRGRSLDDWLRKGEVRIPGGSTTPLAYACSDFSLSSAPTRPGLLIVATIDLATDTLKSRSAAFAEPGDHLRLEGHPLRRQRPLVVVARARPGRCDVPARLRPAQPGHRAVPRLGRRRRDGERPVRRWTSSPARSASPPT